MDILLELHGDVLCLKRRDTPPPKLPLSFPKRTAAIEWFRDAPLTDVVRAALYKRAFSGHIEHFNGHDLALRARTVDVKGFAWVSRAFYETVSIVPITCATDEMKWIMTDRLLRPLVSRKHLARIRENVVDMRKRIDERGTSPRPLLPSHVTLDAPDFVTQCSRAAEIQTAYARVHDWLGETVVTPDVDWMQYVENPVHESIDARIHVVASMVSDSQQDIVWHAPTQEFVVRLKRKNPEWYHVAGPYWSCERLARLNSERKNKSIIIEKEFEQKLIKHAAFFDQARKFLMKVDEACFYAPYVKAGTAYPDFVDTPAGTDEIAYWAQCGFPVAAPTVSVRRFFDVSMREPNDGVFSKSRWAEARKLLFL